MKKSFHFRQWKCLLLTSKPSAQGFTMLEVLAALMISFAFLTGTLNAMLITALMQVKAERQSQASYWIQQDLERVRSEAANLPASSATSPTYTTSSACGGNFSLGTSYGRLLLNALAANANLTAASLDITTASGTKQAQIVKTTETSTGSIANSTRKFFGKEYRLVRIAEGYDTTPQILRLTYIVGLPNDTDNIDRIQDDTATNISIIATLYTEIIPAPALSC